MSYRSTFLPLVIASMAACGGTPHAVEPAPLQSVARAPAPIAKPPRAPDPDLERPPAPKLLAIDWTSVSLASDADALAVWAKIAPTTEDWEAKLDEVPDDAARPLALALLRAGNVTCMKPAPMHDCAPQQLDVDDPAPGAGLAAPCLRRILALWSLAQLEVDDYPKLMPVLRALAAIPPPESQLVGAVLLGAPEPNRLELLVIAARAGHRDLVNMAAGRLEEAQLIEAATKHHIAGALEVLSAEAHRATYLAAVTDEAMEASARIRALSDLLSNDAQLAPDLRAVLVKAAASRDCSVAGAAVRALEQRGDRSRLPTRPRARTPEAMMRALCVLASYEGLQKTDEPSLLGSYVPGKGLERVKIAYSALADLDTDGDGDPHTERTIDLVPRAEVELPVVDDLERAMRRCSGTTCTSQDHEFRFTFRPVNGELMLARLEVIERPPCP